MASDRPEQADPDLVAEMPQDTDRPGVQVTKVLNGWYYLLCHYWARDDKRRLADLQRRYDVARHAIADLDPMT